MQFRQKFTDYVSTDYMLVQFKYYDNVLFLADPDVSNNITATINIAGVRNNMVVAVNNHTQIRLIGLSRLNTNTDISSVTISGLYNPATIQPVVTNTSGFQIVITLMSSTSSLK